MPNLKERMTKIIQSQPDDAKYEDVLRALAFDRMIELGLQDSRAGKTISNAEMKQEIASWQK